jgi:hypothetical protein
MTTQIATNWPMKMYTTELQHPFAMGMTSVLRAMLRICVYTNKDSIKYWKLIRIVETEMTTNAMGIVK